MRQTIRGALQQGTSSHRTTAAENSPPSTERVTNKDDQNTASKTAQIVRCNRNALVQSALGTFGLGEAFFGGVDQREVLDEGRQVQQTTRHTLVITKKPCCGRRVSGKVEE